MRPHGAPRWASLALVVLIAFGAGSGAVMVLAALLGHSWMTFFFAALVQVAALAVGLAVGLATTTGARALAERHDTGAVYVRSHLGCDRGCAEPLQVESARAASRSVTNA